MGSQCQRYLEYVEWVEGITKTRKDAYGVQKAEHRLKEKVFPTVDY